VPIGFIGLAMMYYANFARDGCSLVKRGLEINVIDNMAVAFKSVICKQWRFPTTAENVRTVLWFDSFIRFIKVIHPDQ
jgi:hypothetical protein